MAAKATVEVEPILDLCWALGGDGMDCNHPFALYVAFWQFIFLPLVKASCSNVILFFPFS